MRIERLATAVFQSSPAYWSRADDVAVLSIHPSRLSLEDAVEVWGRHARDTVRSPSPSARDATADAGEDRGVARTRSGPHGGQPGRPELGYSRCGGGARRRRPGPGYSSEGFGRRKGCRRSPTATRDTVGRLRVAVCARCVDGALARATPGPNPRRPRHGGSARHPSTGASRELPTEASSRSSRRCWPSLRGPRSPTPCRRVVDHSAVRKTVPGVSSGLWDRDSEG